MPRQFDPSAAESAKKEYRPSDWVLNRIKEFPFKQELLDVYGINLFDEDKAIKLSENREYTVKSLVKNADAYGVLEAFANGTFTQRPVQMRINEKELIIKSSLAANKRKGSSPEELKEIESFLRNHLSSLSVKDGYFTVRLVYVPDKNFYNVDYHEVKLVRKIDPETADVVLQDGKEKQSISVEPLRPEEFVYFKHDGVTTKLSYEDTNKLRLMDRTDIVEVDTFNGEKKQYILYKDKYNAHEVCPYTPKQVEAQFNSRMQNRTEFSLNNQFYRIRPEDIPTIATGSSIFVYNTMDPTDRISVYFEPASRKIRPTILSNPKMSYDEARRIDVETTKKALDPASAAAAKTQAQEKGAAQAATPSAKAGEGAPAAKKPAKGKGQK